MKTFNEELAELLNRHSMENNSNTPDYILAQFMRSCLNSFDWATRNRTAWYDGGNDKKDDNSTHNLSGGKG